MDERIESRTHAHQHGRTTKYLYANGPRVVSIFELCDKQITSANKRNLLGRVRFSESVLGPSF